MSIGRASDQFIEVFLQPGDYYFSDADTRLRTLLGSCVSITMWHPIRHLGGMCHFLLPTRLARDDEAPVGRYGDEALFLLMRLARQQGCRPREFEYKVFGGACMTDRETARRDRVQIGQRNVRMAFELLEDFGVHVVGQDVGGFSARSIMLDNWSGSVWVRNTNEFEAAMDQELLRSA